MNSLSLRALYWTPRGLGIAFALFLGIFALDAFTENAPFWVRIGSFLIHLIPGLIAAAVVALAWRWEWVGAVVFAGLGAVYAASVPGRPGWILVIAGPMFVLAGLFGVGWVRREVIRGQLSHERSASLR